MMEVGFHEALQEGVGLQEFAHEIRLNEIAKYLVNLYLGFTLLCKVVHDRAALEGTVQTTLSILD
jgi:hypothetical protein